MITRELLWNPEYFDWPIKAQTKLYQEFLEGKQPTLRWSLGNINKPKKGERVFLRKTGKSDDRGIMLSGYLTCDAFKAPKWDDEKSETTYSFIMIDYMLEPGSYMSDHKIAEHIPDLKIPRRKAHDISLYADKLEKVWEEFIQNVDIKSDLSDERYNQDIEAKYSSSLRKVRLHQSKFRKLIFKNYENECLVCGINQIEILDAAHIIPDSEGGKPTIENGRIFCKNHHKAFDSGFFTIDSETNLIEWIDESNKF